MRTTDEMSTTEYMSTADYGSKIQQLVDAGLRNDPSKAAAIKTTLQEAYASLVEVFDPGEGEPGQEFVLLSVRRCNDDNDCRPHEVCVRRRCVPAA